jgi:hypothetical protein
MRFKKRSKVEDVATMERRRESQRVEMFQPAELLTHDGRSIDIDFLDLSRDGFKIRHHEDLMVGDMVTITSARGTKVQAQIKWIADQMAGGIFLDPPPEVG